MKKFLDKYTIELLCVLLAILLMLSGCGQQEEPGGDILWEQITMENAVELMKSEEEYIILDVRRADEFASGHIPGAVNLPNETVGEAQSSDDEAVQSVLPERDQLILVYCRSGNRSKQAAQKLADLGYTNVKEFGGIQDWTGEIEY